MIREPLGTKPTNMTKSKKESTTPTTSSTTKKKPRTFVFMVPIFGVAVQVSIGDKEIIDEGFAGQVLEDGRGGYWVRVSEEKTSPDFHDTLAHEVFHLTVAILSRAGAKLSSDSEEVFAHLNGYITGEIYKRI